MRTVGKDNIGWIKAFEVLHVLKHLGNRCLLYIAVKDERLGRMASKVVKHVKSGLEMGPSGLAHEATEAANAESLFHAGVGEPIETTNKLDVTKAALAFERLNFFLGLGTIFFK